MAREPLREVLALPTPEALHRFVRRWHGIAGGDYVVPVAARLPAALRDFYRSFGPAADAWFVNRLLSPADVREDDGFAVFYVEEQGVCVWGIAKGDLPAEDPPVWCRENGPGKPWVPDAPSVSVFLVQIVVMSAALNGPHGAAAAWLTTAEAERVLAHLELLDLPPWHWPAHPTQWYAGGEAVAFTCPNVAPGEGGDAHLSVWVGALSEGGVRFIEPYVSDAWEYYSPRDGPPPRQM